MKISNKIDFVNKVNSVEKKMRERKRSVYSFTSTVQQMENARFPSYRPAVSIDNSPGSPSRSLNQIPVLFSFIYSLCRIPRTGFLLRNPRTLLGLKMP